MGFYYAKIQETNYVLTYIKYQPFSASICGIAPVSARNQLPGNWQIAFNNTANSINFNIDNSGKCNMQRQKIVALITVSHANVKIYHAKHYICNPVRPPMR